VYRKRKGLPPGAAASCAVFNFFINPLVKVLNDAAGALGSNPASTFFADDGAILANDIDQARTLLKVAEEWADRRAARASVSHGKVLKRYMW
jgi:hypothetical protein